MIKEVNNQIWLEVLPANCPPSDAELPSDFICFRLTSRNPPDESDYYSQRKIYPEKTFHINECIARSLSVFNDRAECEKIRKLPAHRDKYLVSLCLFPGCGLIKKTCGSKPHYSWWVLKSFLNHIKIEVL
jgi:hypothetical protein